MRIHFFTLVVLMIMAPGRVFSQEDNDEYGNDPELQLIIAADKGDTLQVKQSLQKGVNVNAVSQEGVTSLMYAVQNGNIPMISLLLKGGASPDLKPANGLTALISSVVGGQFEITEMLLRSGANINL
jgi:ankyrin repeat protein